LQENLETKRNATGDVEVLQKTETASESIGLEIRKAQAGKRTKLGAFLFCPGFIILLLLFG
jgi:hypothetical protein